MTINKNGLTIEVSSDCDVVIEGDKITIKGNKPSAHYDIYAGALSSSLTISDIMKAIKSSYQGPLA